MQIFKLVATTKRDLARPSDFSVLEAMPQLAGTEPATTITYSWFSSQIVDNLIKILFRWIWDSEIPSEDEESLAAGLEAAGFFPGYCLPNRDSLRPPLLPRPRCLHCSDLWDEVLRQPRHSFFSSSHSCKWSKGKMPFSGGMGLKPLFPPNAPHEEWIEARHRVYWV